MDSFVLSKIVFALSGGRAIPGEGGECRVRWQLVISYGYHR
jgi:hypothetical protein